MQSIYINDIVCWAPGKETNEDWLSWAKSDIQDLLNEKISPKLAYVDALFKRRFSQLTKMSIEVLHELIEKTGCSKETKIIFITNRGEVNQEYKINKMLIEDEIIMPAAFSLSVFNASIALASIVNKTTGGYSVVIPTNGNFKEGLLAAAAPILSEEEKQIILVYGDEYIISAYDDIHSKDERPLAFAALLKSKENISSEKIIENNLSDPKDFLKKIINTTNFDFSISYKIEV